MTDNPTAALRSVVKAAYLAGAGAVECDWMRADGDIDSSDFTHAATLYAASVELPASQPTALPSIDYPKVLSDILEASGLKKLRGWRGLSTDNYLACLKILRDGTLIPSSPSQPTAPPSGDYAELLGGLDILAK